MDTADSRGSCREKWILQTVMDPTGIHWPHKLLQILQTVMYPAAYPANNCGSNKPPWIRQIFMNPVNRSGSCRPLWTLQRIMDLHILMNTASSHRFCWLSWILQIVMVPADSLDSADSKIAQDIHESCKMPWIAQTVMKPSSWKYIFLLHVQKLLNGEASNRIKNLLHVVCRQSWLLYSQ
jgi:hypothetical protein